MIAQLISAKVKALAELGLTNTKKVRGALIDSVAQNPNRYPPYVLQQTYFSLLNDFYNGNTEYCTEDNANEKS